MSSRICNPATRRAAGTPQYPGSGIYYPEAVIRRQPAIHIGTSGWHYDHWRARFYPSDLPKNRWFDYYARHFKTVEVNNTFYRQPKPETWDAWREAAPPGFRFAVKANRYITHLKRFVDCEQPVERFLREAGRLRAHLGPVLFQTPPDFALTDETLERLEGFLRQLPRRRGPVFEFRNKSWFVDKGFDLLRRHGVAFCIHDSRGLECPVVTTADLAYVRFHGGPTHDGNYSRQALEDWAGRIRRLTEYGASEVWLYFNNDVNAYAIDNARTMGDLLGLGHGVA